jgi:protocatechuate 3,4-dioxygenase beta subunit
LSSIEDAKVRNTLVARREAGRQSGGPAHYHFDIVMQGENETAFLEL